MRILTHCIDKVVGVVKVVYCGEGETFKERVADMKNLVETRELQNALLYDIRHQIFPAGSPVGSPLPSIKSDNWTGFLSYTEMPENDSPAFYHAMCPCMN